MKFQNLSDGTKDGFALFYLKDGKLNSVLLNEDEATVLDLMLNTLNATDKTKPIKIKKCDNNIIMSML